MGSQFTDCMCVNLQIDWKNVFALVASPLTKVKLINQLNEREADLGVKESVSWHSEYKDSAWIFIGKFRMRVTMVVFSNQRMLSFIKKTVSLQQIHVTHHMLCSTTLMFVLLFTAGGFPYELSEGDVICVFSQYVNCMVHCCYTPWAS